MMRRLVGIASVWVSVACAWMFVFAAPLRADVIVVDPGGGDGVLALRSAVSTAADGDILLLKAGNYLPDDWVPVTIFGKGLSILPDEGVGPVAVRGFEIIATPAGSLVHLRGFDTQPVPGLPSGVPGKSGLRVKDALGDVWVEQCTLRGRDALPNAVSGASSVHPAVQMEASAGLILERCGIEGGRGADSLGSFPATSAASGVEVLGVLGTTQLVMHECSVKGGDAGQGQSFIANGGHAFVLLQGTASVSGNTFTGGAAGSAGILIPDGGDAVFVADDGSSLWDRGNTLVGGAASPPAIVGMTLNAPAGSVTTFWAPPRSAQLAGLVREGQPVSFAAEGLPGDAVFLFSALSVGQAPMIPLQGVFLLPPPFSGPGFLGFVSGAANSLVVTLPAPLLPVGVDGTLILTQSVFVSGAGLPTLGPGSSLVVLDESL